MLSRKDRIFSELMLARGLVSQELIEQYAEQPRSGDESDSSLAKQLVQSGDVRRELVDEVLEEAQAIDQSLAPHLSGRVRLGEFRLIRELGRGGMGIVYEAEQESLGRKVALKVLPAGAALDDRLAIRFLREARTAAKLRHAGIVPVFASGRADGVLFFAMELVEGRSLAEVVRVGPMAPGQAARLIAEVARALQYAHDAGLVHRDVKPGNIMVGADGRARLTDFGLVQDELAGSFTLSRHVLGTPAFLAPEQALGQRADRRTDLYALGAVLYTLLAGRPPYEDHLPSLILSRVLSDSPPPLLGLRKDLPESLVAICERAMARKSDERYAEAGELAGDLEAFGRGERSWAVVPARFSARRALPWMVVVAAVAAALIVAAVPIGRPTKPRTAPERDPAASFTLVNDTRGAKGPPALSPDGKLLAYTMTVEGHWRVYLQNLETRRIEQIAHDGANPSFSFDGESLIYGAGDALVAVNLRDRSERRFAGRSGAPVWSPDGRQIVATSRAGPWPDTNSNILLWLIDVASARSRLFPSIDARELAYSPHGLRIAYLSEGGGRSNLWTLSSDGRDAVPLTDGPAIDWSPGWSFDGRYVYFGSDRGGTPALWRVAVEESSGRPAGTPELAMRISFPGVFSMSVSANGKKMAIVSNGDPCRLFRFTLDGAAGTIASAPTALARQPGPALSPDPSPDGGLLVYTSFSPDEDLAIVPAYGAEEPRLLTNDAFQDRAPRWSPDGASIVFHSNRSGNMEIWSIRPDGSDLHRLTHTPNGNAVFPVLSPGGDRLAYTIEGSGGYVSSVGRLGEVGPPVPLPESEASHPPFEPWSWSPDGTLLAGSSDGVVVYSISEKRYRRITRFGQRPVWLKGGRQLAFTDDRTVWTVDRDGSALKRLYAASPCSIPPYLGVAPDGRSIYASLVASSDEIWISDVPR